MAFGYYKKLTINTGKCPSTQSHLPLVLPFLSADSDINGHARSDGHDIRPYADSGHTTALNYELVWYSSGAFEMWVDMGSSAILDGGNIYLFYGDAGLSGDGSGTAVWDTPGYKGVWHGGSSSTLSGNDSTTSPANMTNTGGMIASAGKIGGGFQSNASVYMAGGNIAKIKPAAAVSFAMSAWTKITGNGRFQPIFDTYAGNLDYMFLRYDTTNALVADWRSHTTGLAGLSAGTGFADNNWHYIVHCHDDNGVSSADRIYVDGTLKASTTSSVTGGINNDTIEADIGSQFSGSLIYGGTSDEVRVNLLSATSSLSADWITIEYNNQSAPTSFWTTGAEQTVGGGGGSTDGWARRTNRAIGSGGVIS